MFTELTFGRLLLLFILINVKNYFVYPSWNVRGEKVPECPEKCNKNSSQSLLTDFCNEHGEMTGRCCFNETVLVGLDLSNCNFSSLSGVLQNYTKLVMLELQDNPIINCSQKDFVGLVDLEILHLPNNCSCPGGDNAWVVSNRTNDTFTDCESQQNPCVYRNVSCTSNGRCIHVGPGSAKCTCRPSHYGYQCLKEGKFPTEIFVLSLCLPTICLSFVLWYTQRRHINGVKQD